MKSTEKSTAMLAYIPFVGFMIAFFVNREDLDPFATWHIKNAFGLFILFIISMVIMNQVHLLAGDILWLIALFLWIYSFIMAMKYKEIGVPRLSEKFQQWFTFLD